MAWRERARFGVVSVEKTLAVEEAISSSTTVTAAIAVVLPTYTVATAPAAASYTGGMIYLSDGAGGNPTSAVSDGTNWLRSDTLATAAAS